MRTLPRLLFPVLFLVLMPACAALKSRSPLFERVGKSNMSVGELRIRMGDMARRFPGVLEATADVAAERSHSAGTREALLRFKSNAVPVMQSALLQPDPVAGLIDGWALLAQLEQSLPTRAPPEVVDTLQRSFEELESEVELLWRELSGRQDVSNLRALVHAWAAEHPLTGTLVSRESTVPLLAEFTDRSGVGLLGATAAALQDTRDLVQRVDLYVGTLPRQVRWQAELATQEVLEAPTLVSAVHELERAVDVLVRVGALADRTPQWVTGERQSLQDFLSSERRAVLDGVRGERVAVLDSLHVERVETLAQLEPLARGWVDHAFDRATALVNHVFLWLLGLLVLFLLGLLLVTALLARAWRQGEGLPWDRSRGGVGSSREQRALASPPCRVRRRPWASTRPSPIIEESEAARGGPLGGPGAAHCPPEREMPTVSSGRDVGPGVARAGWERVMSKESRLSPVELLRQLTLSAGRLATEGIASGAVRGATEELRAGLPELDGQLQDLLRDVLAILGRMAHEAAERPAGQPGARARVIAEEVVRGALGEFRRSTPGWSALSQELLERVNQWLERSAEVAASRQLEIVGLETGPG